MKLIGISGKPGSQKFVYAFRLIQELRYHGYQTEVVSLAEALYEEFNIIVDQVLVGCPEDSLIEAWDLGQQGEQLLRLIKDGDVGPKYDFGYHRRNETVRKGLTMLGSSIRRKQNPDYFVAKLLERTSNVQAEFGVLTDLRYPNEADCIKAAGGLTLRAELVAEDSSGGFKYEAGREDPVELALDDYTDFFAYLTPESFNRVSFGRELLEYFDLPWREEVIR